MKAYGLPEKGIHLENQDSYFIRKNKFAVADRVTISKGNPKLASSIASKPLKNLMI